MKNTNTELSESPDVLLELQQTRAELKRIQEIHEALLNSIDEMLWTIDMATGKMIDASSACERIFGYGSEELCDIIDVWKQFVHPADHKMMERSNDDLMAGKPVRKQFRIIHKDDSVKWLESKITPTLNEKGELIRLSGVTRDISKEKRANIALMESELLFRQFFDHAHEALLILDADTGYFCDYNQNALQLFKCSGSQMLSRTPAMLSPLYQPDGTPSADKADQYIKQTLAGLKPKFEWVIQNDDENLIPCEVKLNLINSQGRRLVRSSIVDISERKRAEAEIQALNESLEAKVQERTAELTEANNQLEAFSYTVSHDLQTPLRAIAGFSQLLASQHREKLDADSLEMIDVIHSSTRRMSRLIKDLLEFAKVGKSTCSKSDVAIDEMVREVIDELCFDKVTNTSNFKLSPLPAACCDASLTRQVWINLIGNAVKYSAKKEVPIIEIGATDMDGETVYYVKDNGAGFDMDHAQDLFRAFKRLHSSNEFEGTGIGLATVHRIITKQGGRIWAEAAAGSGACFYFTLSGHS